MNNQNKNHPPVIDYEGSDYQTSFWKEGGREYEDRCEQIALKRLLPDEGGLLLEIGAGAGRNTPRYTGFKRVVLLDYSLTQVQQAQEYLGKGDKYVYVIGDVYRLPFIDNLFDGATMIRVLHHMKDPQVALGGINRVLQNKSPFLLEYANKQNLKAILRYWMGVQEWSPFTLEAIEFEELNFDFHPKSVKKLLAEASFKLERQLSVSHFRINFLKKWVPTGILAALDSIFQYTGDWWQLSPSVFTRSISDKKSPDKHVEGFFQCPACKKPMPEAEPGADKLVCPSCSKIYPVVDGIYDFRN
ncbi:MAG: methyltransferase domain-containing protein [Anaerolineales bacterium]|nr:methyltransferase domain-containing protein [Anaerolineales bacterium]